MSAACCVAPEVVNGSFSEKSDEWSIGVILYMLLSGESPFIARTE
jgi:serine/threonine protein kinase